MSSELRVLVSRRSSSQRTKTNADTPIENIRVHVPLLRVHYMYIHGYANNGLSNMRRRNELLIASNIPVLCVALRSGRGAASALAFSPPVLTLVPLSRTTPLRVRVQPTVIGKSTRLLHLRCGGWSTTATGIWSRATDVEEKSTSTKSSDFLGVKVNETDVLGGSAEERSSYVGVESEKHSVKVGENGDGYTLILVLCFFVTVLSALDRVAMSVALVPISAEFLLTDTVKGQISSVFSIGYGLAILPCGLLVAAASPRLVMAAGVALWSIATIGTPLAAGLIISGGTTLIEGADAGAAALTTTFAAENVAPLLAVRAVMGGAESVVLPAVQVSFFCDGTTCFDISGYRLASYY